MNVLKRIIAAVRGGALGMADFLSDTNGINALEHQLIEVQGNLSKVKQDLTDVMGKQMHSSREMSMLKMVVKQHELDAGAALDRSEEAEALKIAQKIAELDVELEEQQQVHTLFSAHVARLRSLVNKTERQIKDYQRQLSMVRTTESIQKASTAIAQNYAASNHKILSARDSLDQIQKRQRRTLDLLEAAEELEEETGEKTLDERLELAGIVDSNINADAVLKRIKSERS
ncbi:MAG: phage shock protein A [Candidatus Azotimanducaceae bacterium]|jgi:phage shock protein A